MSLEWISTRRMIAEAISLAGKLPTNISGIVGIPRSGMIPASVIATQRHLPLWQLTEDGKLELLGYGNRGRSFGFPRDRDGPLAVIDDTVYAGNSMARARAALANRKALFCSVFVRPDRTAAVDYFGRQLPSPQILEWNLMNSQQFVGRAANPIYGSGVACDFDGIICHDHASGGVPGTPYLVPRVHPCRLIATGRHERERAKTEDWLRKHGARWERLEMLADGVAPTAEHIAAHKARWFGSEPFGFFLESEPEQAALIQRLTGKLVICPVIESVLAGGYNGVLPSQAFAETHTDKGWQHNYGPLYDEIVRAKRNVTAVLEIGVLEGQSIKAWSRVFPHASIVAADIDHGRANRVKGIASFVSLDVSDAEGLGRFGRRNSGRFDLIVDDSSHRPQHQLLVQEKLMQALKPGGTLVIEDVHDEAAFEALMARNGIGKDLRAQTNCICSRCVIFTR